MGQKEIRDEFNGKSGEVLRTALNLEANLDYFIATRFKNPPRNQKNFFQELSDKRTFFEEILLQNLTFEKKKDIFKNICKKERCDLELLNETIGSIEFIQKIRNKIAHWHMVQTQENEPFLTNKVGVATESEKLMLSDEVMKQIGKARFQTVTGITKLQLGYSIKKE